MSDSEEGPKLQLAIKMTGGKSLEVEIAETETVYALKEVISKLADTPADRMRLIFSGRILKDPQSLKSYKIQSGNAVHMIKSAPKEPEAQSSGANANASSNAGTANNTSNIPHNIAAGQAPGNPLADLTGARYAGLASLPSASMFGPDGGMGPPVNFEDMRQVMSSPHFREWMDVILNDEHIFNSLFPPGMNGPGGEFARNPQVMRAALEMMMNAPEGSNPFAAFGLPGGMPGAAPGSGMVPPGEPLGENQAASADSSASGAATGAGTGEGAGTGGAAGAGVGASAGAGANAANLFGGNNMFLQALLQQQAQQAQAQPVDNRPPEERYESQLMQLNELGFFDFDRNVRALRRSGGNVQGAIEALLDGQI